MAGAGYKLFTTGSVLTAADVNTYLAEQTVMVFANAAARTTALSGVVSEGMISYLKDTNAVEVYDGSNWVSSDDPNAIQNTIVDAKGDLIAASAADTPARLAVGNNGETLVADSSTSTGLRWQGNQAAARNTVINGGFDIWQRGTSFATANNGSTFGPDRWNIYRDPGTGGTVSRQTSGLTNFLYSCRVQRDSGTTGTSAIYIWQNFESQTTYPLAGKTIVLSYYARAGANFSPTGSVIQAQMLTGTGTDQNVFSGYTGAATVLDTAQTITTTWTRYSHVITLNSNVTEICPRFYMAPSGTAGANDWFEVTGVQIEIGSVPTTFTRAGGTLAGELAACQRYYVRQGGQSLYQRLANGAFQSSTTAYIQFPHPVTMRVAPTSVDFSTMALNDYNSTIAATNITIDFAGGSMTSLAVTVASGGTQYRPVQLLTNNSTSAYVGLSAEL